jgi:hypothetical protein
MFFVELAGHGSTIPGAFLHFFIAQRDTCRHKCRYLFDLIIHRLNWNPVNLNCCFQVHDEDPARVVAVAIAV